MSRGRGGIDTFNRLEEMDMLDELESMFDEMFPEGLDEAGINDLLWFESDWIFEMLGIQEEEEEEEEEGRN